MKKILTLLFLAHSIISSAQFSIQTPVLSSDSIIVNGAVVDGQPKRMFAIDLFAGNTEVTTIAGLRAKVKANNLRSNKIYITPDGRNWTWNPTSVLADNTGTVIKATAISTGRFEVLFNGTNSILVTWFGLVGDSTIDESSKMQLITNEAYRLKKRVFVDVIDTFYFKNVDFECDLYGVSGAMFRTIGTAVNGNNLLRSRNPRRHITIENLIFDGHIGVVPGNEANGTDLIRFYGTDTTNRPNAGVLIRNCRFQNNGYGAVTVRLVDNVTMRDCFDTLTDFHLTVRDGYNPVYENNIAGAGTSEAASFWGEDSLHPCVNGIARGNRIYNKQDGIAVRYAKGFVIADNYIYGAENSIYRSDNNSNNLLAVNGATGGDIYGNTIIKSRGIQGGWSQTKVHHNRIDSIISTSSIITMGVSKYYTYDNEVSNNTGLNPGINDGIVIIKNSGIKIQMNTVRDDKAVTTMPTALKIDSSRLISISSNRFNNGTSKRIWINSGCDSATIDDDGIGILRIEATTTNTIVKFSNEIQNNSSTTLMNVVSASSPTGVVAANGSRWVRTSGSTGSTFYFMENGSWVTYSSVGLNTNNTWSGTNIFTNGISTSTNISRAAWGLNGANLSIGQAIYTDNTSAAGTVANASINVIRTPTIAATNPITITDVGTLDIEGAPVSGTNIVAVTNRLALLVRAGNVWFRSNGAPLSLGDGTGANVNISIAGGRGLFGYNNTSGNASIQGGSGKGVEVNVNNGAFGSGTVTNWNGTTGNLRIGDATAATATAILDIASTTKGVLFPRMTTAQRTAITLAAANDGLMVYDTDLHKLFLNENGTWVQK